MSKRSQEPLRAPLAHVFPEKLYLRMPDVGVEHAMEHGYGPRIELDPVKASGGQSARVGVYRLVGEVELVQRVDVIVKTGEL